jgi:hypothetical protein
MMRAAIRIRHFAVAAEIYTTQQQLAAVTVDESIADYTHRGQSRQRH